MTQSYFIRKGEDPRQIYASIPQSAINPRPVFIADQLTALAYLNGAPIAEFTWDDIEYTIKRDKRVVAQTVTAPVTRPA